MRKKGITTGALYDKSRRLTENPYQNIVNKLVNNMTNEEILTRILGENYANVDKVSDDLKTQLYIVNPLARQIIDPSKLSATHRILLACAYPPFKGINELRFKEYSPRKEDAQWMLEHMAKLGLGANDITANHIRFVLHQQSKVLNRIMYKYIRHELLSELHASDWFTVLRDIPNAGKYLDITKMRNKSELRNLIISHPLRVFKHTTLDDMKNSVIGAPEWIRIISRIPKGHRVLIPSGVIDWTTKSVFHHKLKGRNFKKFLEGWTEGIGLGIKAAVAEEPHVEE